NQEEAAHSLVAPHGVIGEEHHMTFAMRHVDDRRLLCDLCASLDHAAQNQIFFRSEAKYDAGICVAFRQQKTRELAHFLGNVQFLLAWRALHRFLGSHIWPGLNHIRITHGTAAAGASCIRTTIITRSAEAGAYRDYWSLAIVHIELVVVAIGDRTLF